MNILMINNEPEDFAGRVTAWEGKIISYSTKGFEDAVSQLGLPGMSVDLAALEEIVAQAQQADAVWCESPEALLVWYVAKKRGIIMPPFVIEDEDLLRRVSQLSAWMELFYDESPLEEFVSDRRNVWMHHNRAHRQKYIRAGISSDRLMHLPCSSYLVSTISQQAWMTMRDYSGGVPIYERKNKYMPTIICPGSNRRDYEVFAAATEGLRCRAVVLGYREKPRAVARHIEWKKFVPLEKFIAELSSADMVVVPLLDEKMSGGENSISFSMALGRAVVATESTGTRELIKDGKSGLLVPVQDVDAMRCAIARILNDNEFGKRLGESARKAEERNAGKTRAALAKAFSIIKK